MICGALLLFVAGNLFVLPAINPVVISTTCIVSNFVNDIIWVNPEILGTNCLMDDIFLASRLAGDYWTLLRVWHCDSKAMENLHNIQVL